MKAFVILALAALQVASIAALPPCTCTRNLKPVCGSDGQTYGNECTLECEKSKCKSDLTVASQGNCPNDPNALTTQCICTLEYKPVCANDGKTYPNRCAMECELAKNPDIAVAYEGECDQVKVKEVIFPDACVCTREVKPVCGSNGKDYANACLLRCAASTDPSITQKHRGTCDGSIIIDPRTENQDCDCERNLDQVCGGDGVTYNNECLLKCNGQSVAKQGPCIFPDACVCTREVLPVCGSNGKDYANACLLRCAASTDPSITQKHRGTCDGSIIIDPPTVNRDCDCERNLDQICGEDGVTYNNECLLKCNGQSMAKQGPC